MKRDELFVGAAVGLRSHGGGLVPVVVLDVGAWRVRRHTSAATRREWEVGGEVFSSSALMSAVSGNGVVVGLRDGRAVVAMVQNLVPLAEVAAAERREEERLARAEERSARTDAVLAALGVRGWWRDGMVHCELEDLEAVEERLRGVQRLLGALAARG